MRKLFLFMMTTLDGYFEGPTHDISWHHVDKEFSEFANKQLSEADTILFGRRTYQLMESFWPTKDGLEGDPKTANFINSMPKIVYSKTLQTVEETKHWKNVTLQHEVKSEEIIKLKGQDGKNIIVLGSSNLCVSLIEQGLLDEIRIMVNPVVIGSGTSLFHGLQNKLHVKLTKTREFKNGNLLIYYSFI